MTRTLLPLAVLALLLVPAGATTLTVTLSHGSTGSVSEPLLVTAQVAASSLSSSQVSVSVTLAEKTGGAFSISSATQTLTFTSNSTQTVIWSVTPAQAGTFAAPFTATAKASSGSSSDAPGTATSAGAVTIAARPLLEISCASVPPDPTPGQTVDVTCTLSNPSGRNVTNVQACTNTSGDTLKVIVLSSLPTQTQLFTFPGVASINSPTPPCFPVGTVGSVFAISWSAKTNAGGGNGNGGGGGGGGGGVAVTEEKKEEAVAWDVAPLGEFFADIPALPRDTPVEVPAKKTPVTALVLEAATSVSGGQLAVRHYAVPPKGVAPPGKGATDYGYLSIELSKVNPSDLKPSKVRFDVPRAWMEANGVDPSTLGLHRYLPAEKRWDELATKATGGTAAEAVTPGFSAFAITGRPRSIEAAPLSPSISGPEVSLPGPGSALPPRELITGGLSSTPLIGLGIAAIVGAAGVAFVLLRRRKS